MSDRRLVCANLLPPKKLSDRRNRPDVWVLEKPAELAIRLLEPRRHRRDVEHVFVENALSVFTIGIGGGKIQAAFVLLALALAPVELLDDVR
jgi:hypothetical protein